MILQYLIDFFESTASDIGAGTNFAFVIGGFVGLCSLGLVITLIKKIKGFAFLGG